MKKLLSFGLVLVLSLSVILTGCNQKTDDNNDTNQTPTEKKTVNVVALNGPTGMGMVKLMQDSEEGKTAHDYKVALAAAPDEIVGKVTTGEVDIAAVPANLGATLYNKTEGKIKVLAVNTVGNLAIISNDESIKTMADLKGKTVFSSGQGATPEYAFNYLLEKNNLKLDEDVKVEYKATHQELATLVSSGKADIAVIPYPFATTVLGANKDFKQVLSFDDEWKKVAPEGSELTTGTIIARTEFLENNKDVVDKFLEEYEQSTNFSKENVDEAAKLIDKYGIIKEAVAKNALPNCGITFIKGDKMESAVSQFLDILFKSNPKSVGGKLPNEDFYYKQ